MFNFSLPNIIGRTAEEQVGDITRFLFQLVQDLNYAVNQSTADLPSIDIESITRSVRTAIVSSPDTAISILGNIRSKLDNLYASIEIANLHTKEIMELKSQAMQVDTVSGTEHLVGGGGTYTLLLDASKEGWIPAGICGLDMSNGAFSIISFGLTDASQAKVTVRNTTGNTAVCKPTVTVLYRKEQVIPPDLDDGNEDLGEWVPPDLGDEDEDLGEWIPPSLDDESEDLGGEVVPGLDDERGDENGMEL